jgi:hypothetical protein
LLKAATVIPVLLAALSEPSVAADPIFPGGTWENVDPGESGWSATELKAVERYAREIGSTAVMIVHDGRVVASWGMYERKSRFTPYARA